MCGPNWELKPVQKLARHKRVDRFSDPTFGRARAADKGEKRNLFPKHKNINADNDEDADEAHIPEMSMMEEHGDEDDNNVGDDQHVELSEGELDLPEEEQEKILENKRKALLKKKQEKEEFVMLPDETPKEFETRVNRIIRERLAKTNKNHKTSKQRKLQARRLAKKERTNVKQKAKALDKRDQDLMYDKEEIVFGDVAEAPPKFSSKIRDCNKRDAKSVFGKSLEDYAKASLKKSTQSMRMPPALAAKLGIKI